MAAAVLDHNGHPLAGLAVTYPHTAESPLGGDEQARLVTDVRRAAADLSRRLGHRG